MDEVPQLPIVQSGESQAASEQYAILTIIYRETEILAMKINDLRMHPLCNGLCLYCQMLEEEKRYENRRTVTDGKQHG